MAYLITCAGSKRTPINNPSQLENLSFNNELFIARETINAICEIDLDWNRTLPAWQLYSGSRSKIYPQISVANWTNPNTSIKILSALFGWIKHTDLIPIYDLRMSDRIGGIQLWRIWRNTFDLSILVEEDDIDLLSTDYRKAVHGSNDPIATIPQNVVFTDYGIQKGRWINNNLNNLIF